VGKGDKKTRKGKRFRSSFGKTRPKKEKQKKAKEKQEKGD
jgi:ribosomal small subunit protein bTHX